METSTSSLLWNLGALTHVRRQAPCRQEDNFRTLESRISPSTGMLNNNGNSSNNNGVLAISDAGLEA